MSALRKSEDMKNSRTITAIRQFEAEYHKGFYAPDLSFAEKLQNESLHCLCKVNFDSGILSIYDKKQMNKLHVNYPHDVDPMDVFDISVAVFILKPIPGQRLDSKKAKLSKAENRLLTITNIPGHRGKSIILVIESGGKAKKLFLTLTAMQQKLGLHENEKVTQNKLENRDIDKNYLQDLNQISEKFGRDAQSILMKKIEDVSETYEEMKQLYDWKHHDLRLKTSNCESRNHQIKIKEDDIAAIKDKILRARPQNSYRYIVPYGTHQPNTPNNYISKKAHCMVKDDACNKLFEQRALARMKKWKIFDTSFQQEEILSKDILKQASFESNKKYRVTHY